MNKQNNQITTIGEITSDHISLEKFNDREKSMILARQEVKIKDIHQDDYEDKLVNIVQTTFVEYGRRKPSDQAELEGQQQDDLVMCFTLGKDLKRDFKFLTLKDIETCFSMGVRGEFGKIIGINIRTFYSWLKAFDERRRIALKLHKIAFDQTIYLEEPTPTPRFQMSIEDLQVHFDEVQEYLIEHGRLPIVADWLCVFWYLSKTDQTKPMTGDKKINDKFNKFFESYMIRTERNRKDGKKVQDIIKDINHDDHEIISAKRQQFAKFYFMHTFKLFDNIQQPIVDNSKPNEEEE